MKKNNGFTVLELMLVVGIIGVLSAVAVPGYVSWLPGHRLKNAAMDLYANLQLARMNAVKYNRDYMVVFDPDDNYYELVDSGGVVEPEKIELSGYRSGVAYGHGNATHNALKIPTNQFPDDNVSYRGDRVTFDAEGKSEGAVGWVYLQAGDGNTYAVGTPYMTGLVLMKRWNGVRFE